MSDKPKRIWRDDVTLESLRERALNTMVTHLGIEFTELGDDFLRATMKVDSRTCQPMRILHGGASVALAETLASVAANAIVDQTRFACVGQEINANHLRPVPQGHTVTGTARPIHIGAKSQVWSTEIVNERGQLICISRMTIATINSSR
ncbi:MAG: hotdog fold thioesterase [Steroidobacter sp.]